MRGIGNTKWEIDERMDEEQEGEEHHLIFLVLDSHFSLICTKMCVCERENIETKFVDQFSLLGLLY